MRYGRALLPLWSLDPRVRYLNHGAFGAAPRAVLEAQRAIRDELEREPTQFMVRVLPRRLRRSAARLAAFLGTTGAGVAFTENATAGVNAVMRSIAWRRGDQVLLSDHAYPAVANTAAWFARSQGIEVRSVRLPWPARDPGEVVDAFVAAATARTRLAIVDHVTSPTALVLPVAGIVRALRRRGIAVLVDGAHAAGMVPLALDALGADWYAGTCHKWLCAPKGCAFLWAAPRARRDLHPAVISNFLGEPFPAEFDWTGTRDPSAWLALPAALDFHRHLGGARLRRRNRALALEGARVLADALDIGQCAPPGMLGAMASLVLPAAFGSGRECAAALNQRLFARHRIEVPVIPFRRRLLVRISAQAYNEREDYERLARALGRLRGAARSGRRV